MKLKMLGVLLLMAVMSIPAFAAYDMYLQIEGVAGTVTDTAHKDWIPISEIEENTVTAGGVSGLVISKAVDTTSGLLYRDCLTAKVNPSARLDVSKDGVLMYKILLHNPVITQVKPKFIKTESAPQEELSFSFRDINWEFYGPDGKMVTRTGWDNVMKRGI